MAWADKGGPTAHMELVLHTEQLEKKLAVLRHMFSMLGYALDNTLLELRQLEDEEEDV